MDLDSRIAAFAPRKISIGGKALSYRESGQGEPLVLLHGIGSGSASWLFQLEELGRNFRVLAWDAPGYGDSDTFNIDQPHPRDYAAALSLLLAALKVRPSLLVGQSLGALMAGAYAREFAGLSRLLLISPAGGYRGDRSKVADRLKTLDTLGPDGLAEKRAGAMLSPAPPAVALELVRWNYRRIRRDGYRQASYCLANGDLRADAPFFKGKALVACGSADTVTPEAGCREIAAAFASAAYRTLPGLGHASQAEGPPIVNEMIRGFIHE
jgi:pimeloyl-ACP methyl ester carboxylesterase